MGECDLSLIPSFILRHIGNKPYLVKVVDNIGWLFLDKILRMSAGIFVGVWVARYLGPEKYGLMNFGLAFTGLFAAISGLGLQSIVVRDLVRKPVRARIILGTAAVLQLLGGILAYLLILASISFVRPEDTLARSIVAILGAIQLFEASKVVVYWFEARVQSKYTVWVQSGVFFIFSIVKVILIKQNAPLQAFVWAMLVEASVVATVLLLIMNRIVVPLYHLRVTLRGAKKLLKNSWPLLFSSISIMLYMKIDQIMLGQMIGDRAVGVFAAATQISEVWYFIPTIIVASLFPAILDAKGSSQTLYLERFQKLYDLMVVISVAVALPMTFLAKPLIVLLFGETYQESGHVLAIHIWASIFVFLGVASSRWFVVENQQMLFLYRTIIGSIINILMNYFLIPVHGPVGAALSTVFAQFFVNVAMDYFQTETRGMFKMKIKSLNIFRLLTFGVK
jgi:O-antigen/teichoic acid export membrane protein